MIEAIVLGIVQGIAEWLPVSSEGIIFLIKTNFFGGEDSIVDIIRLALFLHLGTFLAALVYFRKEVFVLLKALFNYKKAGDSTKKILNFLIFTTIISGSFGFVFLKFLKDFQQQIEHNARFVNLIIGILLLITAFLQFKSKLDKNKGLTRGSEHLNKKDNIILGLAQAFATLPGLSRSGLTVSALLLRKFKEDTALKLSFLMSMPIVLGGNIVLTTLDGGVSFSKEALVMLFFSFLFGLLTIDILLKIAKKVDFAIFVLIFAILTIASVFI